MVLGATCLGAVVLIVCAKIVAFFYVMAPTGPLAMAGHICLRNGRLFLVQCMQAAWV